MMSSSYKFIFVVIHVVTSCHYICKYSPFLIDNYDFVFKSRQGRVGGGVVLYVLKTFNYVVHDDISIINNVFETFHRN